jgi:hypothetical protein
VDFVTVRKKSAKDIIDVRRPKSLWCQTGVIFVIGQKALLFGGYMQRGVEIRHGNKKQKFKFCDASTTRSHDPAPAQKLGRFLSMKHESHCRILPCGDTCVVFTPPPPI